MAACIEAEPKPFYNDAYAHLQDELQKLDLLIRRRTLTLRLASQTDQRAAGVQAYISHSEVDRLLAPDEAPQNEPPELGELRRQLIRLQQEIDARVKESLRQGVFLALPQLAHLFGLSPFELQTVIICLAPELRRKYDKLYAYLQDDVTRRKPGVDLVLDLLCETDADRWRARPLFSGQAPLFRAGILQPSDDPYSPSGSSGLAQFLKLDPRLLDYILGADHLDDRLEGIARLLPPWPDREEIPVEPVIKTRLVNLSRRHFGEQDRSRKPLVLSLTGPYGVGKQALARGLCGELTCPLLSLDLALLLAQDGPPETLLRIAFREGLLLQAALYLENVDVLQAAGEKGRVWPKQLAQVIAEYGWLVFLAGDRAWSPQGVFEQTIFLAVELPPPGLSLRETAWRTALDRLGLVADPAWAGRLAGRFRLTPGQIQAAAEAAQRHGLMTDDPAAITFDDLAAACRRQSRQNLGRFALKIDPHYEWADLILPPDKLTQLKEICSQVKHHDRVFERWGFGRKIAHGQGLSVLFSGPPGVGKTMAAEVMACALRLDLYKIDLSGVVSKYIGETEKNLATIFAAAETGNAILFFDEADALFGKRTEVSDAHDRYANIETSYLLQKMEEYDGVVILATNLRENMDEAFTRRIRFIVEFPFPDVAGRREIWRTHFPAEAPVSEAIDYDFLARQFSLAGGNIKNIVLYAAFFAAADGGEINPDHILQGARREFEKMGKLWNEQQFSKPER